MNLHEDFVDFIKNLLDNQVEFVIVGAHAKSYITM